MIESMTPVIKNQGFVPSQRSTKAPPSANITSGMAIKYPSSQAKRSADHGADFLFLSDFGSSMFSRKNKIKPTVFASILHED